MKEEYIPGIDNYCDRWCERCSLTARCQNYKKTTTASVDSIDINNPAFWEHITENFQKTVKLLYKTAKEHGVALDSAMTKEEEDKYEKRRTFLKKAAKDHRLSKLCNEYQKVVMPFVKNNSLVEDKTKELRNYARLGIKTEKETSSIVGEVNECFDIIQWYVFFIGAKLQRALNGKLEGESGGLNNRFQKDSDGSAKITIIAIDKTINAWVKLYELMPSTEDEALTALSLLSQLKNKALEDFPNAMQFKRPGFDD
jgi:hypothetical protein